MPVECYNPSIGSRPPVLMFFYNFKMTPSLLLEYSVTDTSTTIYMVLCSQTSSCTARLFRQRVHLRKGRPFFFNWLLSHMHSKKCLIFYRKIRILFSISHLKIKNVIFRFMIYKHNCRYKNILPFRSNNLKK